MGTECSDKSNADALKLLDRVLSCSVVESNADSETSTVTMSWTFRNAIRDFLHAAENAKPSSLDAAWAEWLAHAETRDPNDEVRMLNYLSWTAVLRAAISNQSSIATNAAPQEKTEGQGLNLSPVDARGEAPAVAAPGDAHGGTWVRSATGTYHPNLDGPAEPIGVAMDAPNDIVGGNRGG